MRPRLRLVLSLAFALACTSATAHALDAPEAAPTPATLAVAKGREAISLFDEGKYQEALQKLQQADALYHSPVFVLYAGRSLRQLGRWVEAMAVLRRVEAEEVEQAPPQWKQAKLDARRELSELEADVPRLHIRLEGDAPNAQITVDDAPVKVGESFAIDPGVHRVVAKEGDRIASETVNAVPHAPPIEIVFRLPPRPPPIENAPATSRANSPGVWVAGAGGALVLGGGVLGVVALVQSQSARDDLPETCVGTTCPISRKHQVDKSLSGPHTLATIADVLLVTGAIAVTVGVVMVLTRTGTKAAPSAAQARPGPRLELRF